MKAGWKYAWPNTCFYPSPSPLLSSPKKHSFLLSSSCSPPNPSLLHCICFLIRSVWEAHKNPSPPTFSLGFLLVAVTCLHCSSLSPYSVFLSAALIIRQECGPHCPHPVSLFLPSFSSRKLFSSPLNEILLTNILGLHKCIFFGKYFF